MAAEPAERARLAIAFHRISRSVRQTAALKARIEREAERAVREQETEARNMEARQVARRKAQLKASVGRLIWTEYEKSEAEALKDDLEDLLETEGFADDFLTEPAEAQVLRLCEALEIPTDHPREGGEPGDASAPPALDHPSPPSLPVIAGTSGRGPDHPFSSG